MIVFDEKMLLRSILEIEISFYFSQNNPKGIEQLNAQKRRLKVAAHKREAERLVQERRSLYEREREAEISQLASQQVEQEARAVEIEQEKRRLLRESAIEFRDYLPKGMFENRDDYEYVMNYGREGKSEN